MGNPNGRSVTTLATAVVALMAAAVAHGQAPPRNLQSWQVEFRFQGTIAGLNEQLTLNQAGQLTAGYPGPSATSVSTRPWRT